MKQKKPRGRVPKASDLGGHSLTEGNVFFDEQGEERKAKDAENGKEML